MDLKREDGSPPDVFPGTPLSVGRKAVSFNEGWESPVRLTLVEARDHPSLSSLAAEWREAGTP